MMSNYHIECCVSSFISLILPSLIQRFAFIGLDSGRFPLNIFEHTSTLTPSCVSLCIPTSHYTGIHKYLIHQSDSVLIEVGSCVGVRSDGGCWCLVTGDHRTELPFHFFYAFYRMSHVPSSHYQNIAHQLADLVR